MKEKGYDVMKIQKKSIFIRVVSGVLSVSLLASTMTGLLSSNGGIAYAKESQISIECENTCNGEELTQMLSGADVQAISEIATGKCGDNLIWKLDSNGKLTISGTGEMYNFNRLAKEGESNAIPWLNYRSQIKSVCVEEGVTSIGNSAFYNTSWSPSSSQKDSIEVVSLPDSLRKIGSAGFCKCNLLSSIEFPDSVFSIENGAFSGCTSLMIIDLPDELIDLGSRAFEDCAKATEIKFNEKLQSIGESAFSNVKIEKLTIPNTIKCIENSAFKWCRYLKELVVEGDINLDFDAFAGCESLEKVSFNGKISGNCNSIFRECNELKEVSIPSEYKVESGEYYPIAAVFSDCSSLNISNISFTDGAKWIDGVLFSADNKKLLWYPKTLTATSYNIPYGVEIIGSRSFKNQKNITHIGIPNSVNTIQSWAFQNCVSLDNIIIPDGVNEIYCFQDCESLKSIVIPSSVILMIQNGKTTQESFCSSTKLTMYCDSGSFAESFANENNYFITPKKTVYCSFDANGGSVAEAKRAVIPGDKYWSLPVPQREGYEFEGWYTKQADGIKVNNESVVYGENNFILYAHWTSGKKIVSLSDCELTLDSDSYSYSGEKVYPVVTIKNGTYTLKNGIDYTVSYSNNKNVGIATIKVLGKGDYTGEITKNFRINSKLISKTNVVLDKTAFEYDGKQKQPAVMVKDGSLLLTKDEDYTVAYSNNINVGTATVSISGKGNYSGEVIKNFTIVKQKSDEFQWEKDNWNFNNSSFYGYFSKGTYRSQINDKYLNKLKANLSNSEYQKVFIGDYFNNAKIDQPWKGSCHGMSLTAYLSKEGLIPYAEYKTGATELNDIGYPIENINVSSLITYYQMIQFTDSSNQLFRKALCQSNETNIKRIISLLDQSSTVVVGFQKNGWGGHSILAYGYEYGSYTWNGITYRGKIKICDPNSSVKYNEKCNIYFNTDTYNWTIPYYDGITSTSGAKINFVSGDINEINDGGYLTTNNANNYPDYIARIDAAAISDNRSVAKVREYNGNYIIDNNSSDDIVEDYSFDMNGESKGTVGYNLLDGESAYRVTQEAPVSMQLIMDYENCDLVAGSSAGKSVVFDNDGSVLVEGESSDFNIAMTFDEDYPTDWFNIQVVGTNSNTASLEKSGEGYILSAENLEDVDVLVNNKYDSAHANFSTEYQSVYIYEVDKNTIGIKVDTDDNGIYETDISTKINTDNITATLSTDPYVFDGKEKKPIVTVKDNTGRVIESSNYEVTYVNNVNAGTATIKVIMKGNYFGTLTKTFTIKKASAKTVTLSASSYTYNGKAKKPTVTVKNSAGKVISSSNYTVTYSNNTNAGKATVKVVMKGNYTGTLTKTFNINKVANRITTTSSYTKTALSKAQSFSLGAKAIGGKLTYKSNNKSVTVSSTGKVTIAKNFAGKAVITITASGANHKTVTKAVTITVKPAATKITSASNSSGKKATIKWSKLSYVSGYQIQYGTKSNFSGAKTINVSGASKVSKELIGLTRGKTYYIRIRTYKSVENTKIYSVWSAKKSVKINR